MIKTRLNLISATTCGCVVLGFSYEMSWCSAPPAPKNSSANKLIIIIDNAPLSPSARGDHLYHLYMENPHGGWIYPTGN